jgi:hypothetical protein
VRDHRGISELAREGRHGTAICSSPGSSYSDAAFWVGLDGYTSNTVEQIGTEAACLGSTSSTYYAWYELYPQRVIPLDRVRYPVTADDSLSAEVSQAGGTITLTLTASGTTDNWTDVITVPGAKHLHFASAKWIAEGPATVGGGPFSVSLTDFPGVSFSAASATSSGGVSGPIDDGSWSNDRITMVGGPRKSAITRAAPTSLTDTSDTSAFGVNWQHG